VGPSSANKLAIVLLFVAAGLALSAEAVQFVRSGEIAWEIFAAGLVFLVMGGVSLSRTKRGGTPTESQPPQ